MVQSESRMKLNQINSTIKDRCIDRLNAMCDLNIEKSKPAPKNTKNTFTHRGETHNKTNFNVNRRNKQICFLNGQVNKLDRSINKLNERKLDVIYSDDELTLEYLELEFE